MGSLKDSGKLIDKIDKEMAWRKKELIQLKFLVDTVSKDYETTVIRSSIVLLYAHWEGMVKKLLTLYLDHVFDQHLPSSGLHTNFYALSLLNDFEAFKHTTKKTCYIDLIETINNKLNSIQKIKANKIIDTKSNLNTKLFKELMLIVGLDPTVHETSFNLIDERLLARRNGIAHGENPKRYPLEKEEYSEVHIKILKILDGLADQIKDAVINRSYML